MNNENSLGRAFVFIENEKYRWISSYLKSIIENIDCELINTFHEKQIDSESIGYIKALKNFRNCVLLDLENSERMMNKYQQCEEERKDIHNYFCGYTKSPEDFKNVT